MSQKDQGSAYSSLARDLRKRIENGEFQPGTRLPTEQNLRESYGVSRHTVRAALKALVSDGFIDQVQGSGTYVRGHPDGVGEYVKTINSLEDLTIWPETRIEIVQPFTAQVNPSVASRMRLASLEVSVAILRRSFDDKPFVVTQHYVSTELGQRLTKLGIPNVGLQTIIGAAEPHLDHPIAGVKQSISALNADARIVKQIGVEEGNAVMFIERLYYDTMGTIIELTESFFDPRRYTYRMDLNRRGKSL